MIGEVQRWTMKVRGITRGVIKEINVCSGLPPIDNKTLILWVVIVTPSLAGNIYPWSQRSFETMAVDRNSVRDWLKSKGLLQRLSP